MKPESLFETVVMTIIGAALAAMLLLLVLIFAFLLA